MKTSQLGFEFSAAKAAEEKPKSSALKQEPQVLTVSQLNSMIRGTLESQFQEIWIRGEISNFKAHSSGHYYFSLKDKNAQISAVMFRGMNSKLKFRPEDGLEVMVHGKVTVYEPRGNYQVFCQWMEPVGAGALQKAFEQLKEKLKAEGLFAQERKRPLPSFPKHIGLVTSPTGAAIQDILNVLGRRYKSARITLSPAQVQGVSAADSIVKAIDLINQLKDVDVLIVGRGGGSIEDLWCFNEEKVARAIVASKIPIISAVGHEVDFTIADFVADLRAPTPSAAAELVVKNADDLASNILQIKKSLVQAMQVQLRQKSDALKSYRHRLIDPRRHLQDLILRCDELTHRLEQAGLRYINDCRTRVEMALRKMGSPRQILLQAARRLESIESNLKKSMQIQHKDLRSNLREKMAQLEALSPLKVVQRGYSLVTLDNKKIVKDSQQLKLGEKLNIQFAKGQVEAVVQKIKTDK